MLHPKSIPSKIGWVSFVALMGLLVLESALQVRAHFATPSAIPMFIPDERLGLRPNPQFPGHDSRGWTNPSSLERADIVVLGDSHVYGRSWPQVVGVRLHSTVYQMAAGGYGPPQYALLLDEALALVPKVIIATYDYGDDIYDSYKFVYRIGGFKRSSPDPVLDSSFNLTDVKTQEALARAETIDPELLRRRYLDCREPIEVPDPRLQSMHHILESPPLAPFENEGIWQRGMIFLTAHSAVIKFLRKHVSPKAAVRITGENVWPQLCPRYRDQNMTTLFNPAVRILVLDDTDPRIVEGERLAFLAYRRIAQRCRQPQCSFYVMMVPTKETAFRARAESTLGHQPYMVDLWNTEGRARANASAFFAREHISTIDTLPLLEAVIASGVNPYPEDADVHFTPVGYETIARAVVERLQTDGLKQ